MPEIATTATTESARIQAPTGNVTYVHENPRAGSTYTVTAHPPLPRDQRPQR